MKNVIFELPKTEILEKENDMNKENIILFQVINT
jgi:hypothetical protein